MTLWQENNIAFLKSIEEEEQNEVSNNGHKNGNERCDGRVSELCHQLIYRDGQHGRNRRSQKCLEEIFEEFDFNADVSDDKVEIDGSHGEVSANRCDRRAVNSDGRIGDQNQIQDQFYENAAIHGNDRFFL